MDKKTELAVIRHMIDITRQMATGALKKLDGRENEFLQRFEVNGKRLNSVYWLVAHMAWAQNNLILRSTGGPNPEVPWLKFFALGKPADEGENCGVPYSEIRAGFDKVHQVCLDHLDSLDPASLDEDNKLNWEVLGGKSMRNTLLHHVRHENAHIGQLLWLVNLYGVKTL